MTDHAQKPPIARSVEGDDCVFNKSSLVTVHHDNATITGIRTEEGHTNDYLVRQVLSLRLGHRRMSL